MKILKKVLTALVVVLMLIGISSCIEIPHFCDWELQTKIYSTCEVGGYEIYQCKNCGETKRNTFRATGHYEVVTTEAQASTCTQQGHTEKRTCARCGKVFAESEPLPLAEHNIVIEQEGYPATCEESGLANLEKCLTCGATLQTQTIISPLGHTDEDCNGVCEGCNRVYAENAIEIKTVADLQAISQDLSKGYKLMNDICLSDIEWIPLGSKDEPFTGAFLGNGYTISGLTLKGGGDKGLFGYNSGVIEGVTVEDVAATASNESLTCGFISAVNDGEIVDCRVDGINKVEFSASYELKTYRESLIITVHPKGEYNHEVNIGQICGKNNGVIKEVTLSGEIICTIKNWVNYDINPILSAGYYLTSTIEAAYGGICAVNEGSLLDADAQSRRHRVESFAQAWEQNGGGTAKAEEKLYYGSLIGVNRGTLENCQYHVDGVYYRTQTQQTGHKGLASETGGFASIEITSNQEESIGKDENEIIN